ncbi:MAG: alpha/beta hydrolase [Candidatus Melainabacteria bacterium]
MSRIRLALFRILLLLLTLSTVMVGLWKVIPILHAEETGEDAYEDVEIPVSNGLLMQGRLYDPTMQDETLADKDPLGEYPLVILLHSLNGSGADWHRFALGLAKKGYAVYAPDLRGHGQSTKDDRGRRYYWRTFKDKDWQLMPRDVLSVIRYFSKGEDGDYPQVNGKKTALMGAQLGANIAVLAAARDSELSNSVKAVILLSPSLSSKGLETQKAFIAYHGPVFLSASQRDINSLEATQMMYRWALGAKEIRLYKDIGDGIDMLRLEPSLPRFITAWTEKYFPGHTLAPEPKPDSKAELTHPAAETGKHAVIHTPAASQASGGRAGGH